ncbi:hypothetical protein DF185_18635 [Marinifilum breve]|uniref:DZANK-type domain-containing protein n=1 Tax=Marinifilum breve TaxID=2184082 RepID=A0A2V3ZTK7_9BACT|nr:zinc ribbon domain-containing protein [Marinifilum breve]PXX97042.1 hypothetical protein DF185_18635 [Marinifilum breve]
MTNLKNCPHCGNSNLATAIFCQECGKKQDDNLKYYCPVCKTEYDNATKFCKNDGEQILPETAFVRHCIKCGKEYDNSHTFCPVDGGKIMSDYQKSQQFNLSNIADTSQFDFSSLEGIKSVIINIEKKLRIPLNISNGSRISAWLLYATILISIISIPATFQTFNNQPYFQRGSGFLTSFIWLISVSLTFFIAYKIHLGKKWAKVTFLVFFCIGLISQVAQFFIDVPDYRSYWMKFYTVINTILYIGAAAFLIKELFLNKSKVKLR